MEANKPIQINLKSVLSSKLGRRARYVPGFVVSWLEKVICQNELNDILRTTHPKRGAEFCDSVMSYLDIEVGVSNPEKLPAATSRRLLIVSNHPLGGLDGIALIDLLSRRYGSDIKFVVNDLLMAVEPLSDVFLPINKHGRQDRQAIADINAAMESDAPVMIFPAGLVSRQGTDGKVRDLQWNKMFVAKAVQYRRDVLPLFFSGENTKFFYRFARWRQRLGLKFNIEMIRLPAELIKSRGKRFKVAVGDVIPWQELSAGAQAADEAARIKEIVYSLSASQAQPQNT